MENWGKKRKLNKETKDKDKWRKAEECTSYLEVKVVTITQRSKKKKKKKKFIIIIIIIFNENNLRDFWANIKCTNIPIIQVPKG